MIKLIQIAPLLFFMLLTTQSLGSTLRHRIDPATNTRLISSIRTDTLYNRCPVPRAPFLDSQRNESESIGRK